MTETRQTSAFFTKFIPLVLWGLAALVVLKFNPLASIFYPYPIEYGEGEVINQAFRLSQFDNIYPSDLSRPPFIISNYPPVYYLLQVPFFWLFGPNFWAGRLLSALSLIGCVICIFLIVKKFSESTLAPHISAVFFLLSPFTLAWSRLCRIDLAALCFALWGLCYLLRKDDYSWRTLLTAAALSSLAIFTRQTALVITTLPVAGWLFLRSGSRKSINYLLVLGLICAVVVICLQYLTGDGFLFHTVIANKNKLHPERLSTAIAYIIPAYWLALAVVSINLLQGKDEPRQFTCFNYTVLLSGIITLGCSAKVGANVNYFFELLVALALIFGDQFNRLQKTSNSLWRAGLTAMIVLQLFFPLCLQEYRLMLFSTIRDIETANPARAVIKQIVKETPAPILTDDLLGLNVLKGSANYMSPFLMAQLARQGLWDQNPLLKAVQARKFNLIAIRGAPGSFPRSNRWTNEFEQAVRQNYRLAEKIENIHFYRPKS